jgi:hypothetical protein
MQPAILQTGESGTDRDIARQHRALRLEICELRGVIDSCPVTRRTGSHCRLLAVLVSRLGERLDTHFSLEEDAYSHSVTAAGCVAVYSDVAGLRTAHAALLAEAHRLAEILRTPIPPPDVSAQVLRWLDTLRGRDVIEADEAGR